MHIRIEVYEEQQGRIFVDGVERDTVDRELDIEDFFPLLRELGATVEAVQYDGWLRDFALQDGVPNPEPGEDFAGGEAGGR